MPLVKNIHVKVPLVPLPTSFCLVSKRYVPTWLFCSHDCGSGASARPRGRDHRTSVVEGLPFPRGVALRGRRCAARVARGASRRAAMADPPPWRGARQTRSAAERRGREAHSRRLRRSVLASCRAVAAYGDQNRGAIAIAARARVCAMLAPRVVCGPTTHPSGGGQHRCGGTAAYAAACNVGRDATRGEAAPSTRERAPFACRLPLRTEAPCGGRAPLTR